MTSHIPRLSRLEVIILRLLAQGDTFGLDLVKRSRGVVKRGTVYVTLARMEQKGYLDSRIEPPLPGAIGLRRRLYRPTEYGAAVLAAWDLAAGTLARLRPKT